MKPRKVLTPEERAVHKKHALIRTLVIDVLVIVVSTAILGVSIWKWFAIGGRSSAVGGHVVPWGIGISATGLAGSIVKAYLLSAHAHFKARELKAREPKTKLTKEQKIVVKAIQRSKELEDAKAENDRLLHQLKEKHKGLEIEI